MGRNWLASRHRDLRLFAAAAALLLALAWSASAAHAAVPGDQAVTYQLDPAHDGYQPADQLTMPLKQLWSAQLSGSVSYPLIAGGVAYVTARASSTAYGTTLYAIDLKTGATLWTISLGGTYWWSALAYDGGRVFAVNADGQLNAYDATTGATDWSISLPGQYSFSGAPTAIGGYVYVGGAGSGGTVYAVNESTGAVVWTRPVSNGDGSSPAVDSSGVYVSYACQQDYGFNPLDGSLLWHHSTSCEGGGGATPALADGYLFSRDWATGDLILSAATGTQVGTFSSQTIPAVAGGLLYEVNGGTLTAVNNDGLGTNAWSFAGDGQLNSAPVIGGDVVYEGSGTGELYALDAQTGAELWSTNVGGGINAPADFSFSAPLTGLALGEQTLLVPAGSQLVAYAGTTPVTVPVNQVAPTVVGTAHVGSQLTADPGVWSPTPDSYSYQWLRCNHHGADCRVIAGANSADYTPVISDAGKTLRVEVSGVDSAGTSDPVSSAASAPVRVGGDQGSGSGSGHRHHHRHRHGHHRHGHHRHGHRRHGHHRHGHHRHGH